MFESVFLKYAKLVETESMALDKSHLIELTLITKPCLDKSKRKIFMTLINHFHASVIELNGCSYFVTQSFSLSAQKIDGEVVRMRAVQMLFMRCQMY